MEADPEGGWLRESGLRTGEQNDLSQNGEVEASGSESRNASEMPRVGEAGMLQEMKIIRREKELLERELALARREAEFLREKEREREIRGGRAEDGSGGGAARGEPHGDD